MELKHIIKNALDKAMPYQAYRDLHQQQVKNKSTSGPLQTEQLIDFTKLNNARSKRWDKQFKPQENWSGLAEGINETWLVITETWCGDAAQNIPVLHKIAQQLPGVKMQMVFRDENTLLIDQFLTNGGRSIPKLIRLSKNLEVIGTWGPRPAETQALLKAYKNGQTTKEEFNEAVAKFYVENGGAAVEKELMTDLVSTLQLT